MCVAADPQWRRMTEPARRTVLRSESQKTEWDRLVTHAVVLVVFPSIIGVLGAFTSDIHKAHGPLIWAIWIVLIIFFVAFWMRYVPATSSVLALLRENEDLAEELRDKQRTIAGLETSITLLTYQSALSLSTRGMVAEYVKRGLSTTAELAEALSSLLAPLYLEGEGIFGFGGSERWNFAVYLYSKERDLLVPVWREKARTHPSVGPGRSWGRGQGHVGKAFVDRASIITPDSLHPEVEPLSSAPRGMEADYDREVYRSFAALPIGPLGDDVELPYGVLVGTSDRSGRFDRENVALLAHAAGAVASLVALADINMDSLGKN